MPTRSRHNRPAVTALLALSLTGVLAACASNDEEPGPSNVGAATSEANRELVIDFYDRFFNEHDTSAASVITDDYTQHNPNVPDGKETFVGYFTESYADNPASRNRIVRSAVDGDLVYLHVHSTDGSNDRGSAVVDIFRVQDERIVEHWDVIQEVPETAANQNGMF